MQLMKRNKHSIDLLQAWLNGRAPTTVKAYRGDFQNFSDFCCMTPSETAEHLIRLKPGEAYLLVNNYKARMKTKGLSPATINRRLATLQSVIQLAKMLNLITWELKVTREINIQYRNTAGPGPEAVTKMLETCENTLSGKRDRVIIRMLHDLALRRTELANLNVSDLNIPERYVWVTGKGRRQSEQLTLSSATSHALQGWLECHQWEPLLVSLEKQTYGKRLSPTSIYRIIRKRGKMVGVDTKPHGLRHTAITTAAQNVPAPDVMRFSRHRSLNTVQVYLDKVENVQGKITEIVSQKIGD